MEFQRIGIVGAGQMGSGIARVVLAHGASVVMVDKSVPMLDRAHDGLRQAFQTDVSVVVDRARFSTDIAAVSEADIVIEAVIEDEAAKHRVLEQIEAAIPQGTVLASNTSSLSIEALARTLKHPERFLGVHFMNPAHVMTLVELIAPTQVRTEIVERVQRWLTQLDKVAVVSQDSPGFIVNRILFPMINAAAYLVAEGVASKDDIDTAMHLGAGHPMGPLRLADFIGLDTCGTVLRQLHDQLKILAAPPCPIFADYVKRGWLGQKSGRGFFVYDQHIGKA